MRNSKQENYFSIRFCFAGEEEKIPAALDSYAQNKTDLSNVNRVLELYDIKQFFDKFPKVNGWDEDKYEKYKISSQNVVKEVKAFFDTIGESNLVEVYENCDVTFWILPRAQSAHPHFALCTAHSACGDNPVDYPQRSDSMGMTCFLRLMTPGRKTSLSLGTALKAWWMVSPSPT